ncbi:MAG: hypothetical protein EA344_05360 [Alkalicoccus sp.]|nr:MAG: hypothetical protein EA344_05360 [Alkalicoccus sp.]
MKLSLPPRVEGVSSFFYAGVHPGDSSFYELRFLRGFSSGGQKNGMNIVSARAEKRAPPGL